jgi:ketosteroid isomerase-like protein
VSQDPVEVVRDQFAAVNERDFPRAMSLYADDAVLVITEDVFLNSGTFVGKEPVGEWFGDWFGTFGSDYRFEITDARDLGGGLVYLFAEHGGSGRASGAEVRGEHAYLYRVEDGKVRRVQLFQSEADAMAAARLSEWSRGETD